LRSHRATASDCEQKCVREPPGVSCAPSRRLAIPKQNVNSQQIHGGNSCSASTAIEHDEVKFQSARSGCSTYTSAATAGMVAAAMTRTWRPPLIKGQQQQIDGAKRREDVVAAPIGPRFESIASDRPPCRNIWRTIRP